ncbi:MAG: DNA polymerase III subunit beta [Fibrobacterota bacterium]
MNITIRKAELLSVMQRVISIVPARSTLQILSNLHFKVDGKTLTLRATDLDLSITASIELKGTPGPADFIVNAKKLFDIVKELPETDLQLSTEGAHHLLVATDADEFKLPIQSSENFPETPVFKTLAKLSLKGGLLDDMAARVRFAVAKDTTRAVLKGILCEIEKTSIKMVATDGHKLSLCREELQAEKAPEKKIAIILPPKAFDPLAKVLSGPDELVTVSVGQTYAEFATANAVITTKLIEGDYPNYEEAIPKNNAKKAQVRRDELFSVLRRISVMSNSRTRQIRFAFTKNSLTLSTSDREFRGEGKSSLPLKYDGEAISIGYNADFFSEILRLLDDQEVVITMNTALSATVILPADEKKSDKMLFLIMPLRLLDEEA